MPPIYLNYYSIAAEYEQKAEAEICIFPANKLDMRLIELGILEKFFRESFGGKRKGYEFNAHSLLTKSYRFPPALKPCQLLLHSLRIRFHKVESLNKLFFIIYFLFSFFFPSKI